MRIAKAAARARKALEGLMRRSYGQAVSGGQIKEEEQDSPALSKLLRNTFRILHILDELSTPFCGMRELLGAGDSSGCAFGEVNTGYDSAARACCSITLGAEINSINYNVPARKLGRFPGLNTSNT